MTEWRVYGCGSASSNHFLQTSYELVENGTRLHLDFGNGAMFRRCQFEGYITRVLDSLNHLFLTHSHADHTVDLTRHAIAWKYTPGYAPEKKTHLYGTTETLESVERMIGGMGMKDLFHEVYKLHDFKIGDEFNIEDFNLKIYPAEHIPGSCGVRIQTPEKRNIHFTGDTTYFEDLYKQFQDVDLLVIEASFFEMEHIMHLNLDQVAEIVSKANPKAVLLVHLYPELEDMRDKDIKKKIGKQYSGKVYVGNDGMALKWNEKKDGWRKKKLF